MTGLRDKQWKRLQVVNQGDYLLCYLIRACRFVGVLEVMSLPFKDSAPLWKSEVFPCRIRVKVVVAVQSDAGVPVRSLRGKLTIFRGGPNSWVGHVRGPLLEWEPSDVKVVQEALIGATKGRTGLYG